MKPIKYASIVAAIIIAMGMMNVSAAPASGVCVDEVTAGGWVPDGGGDEFANFGLNARDFNGDLTGQLNFVDADEECHVVSTAIISYDGSGDCRTIRYDVTVNGVSGFTATVEVCDNGESVNDDPDTFSITVFDSDGTIVDTCSVSGDVVNGDVQVHVSGNCP